MAGVNVTGGTKWLGFIAKIAEQHPELRVGFLEGATHSGETSAPGTLVAPIAAVQEFGGVIPRPERKQTLRFRKTKDGRQVFAKATAKRITKTMDVTIGGGETTIPARPFMRQTVEAKKDEWAKDTAKLMTGHPQGAEAALQIMGDVMAKDIQQTIQSGDFAELAASTVAGKRRRGKKTPTLPLVDSGAMQEAVAFEVTGGNQ